MSPDATDIISFSLVPHMKVTSPLLTVLPSAVLKEVEVHDTSHADTMCIFARLRDVEIFLKSVAVPLVLHTLFATFMQAQYHSLPRGHKRKTTFDQPL